MNGSAIPLKKRATVVIAVLFLFIQPVFSAFDLRVIPPQNIKSSKNKEGFYISERITMSFSGIAQAVPIEIVVLENRLQIPDSSRALSNHTVTGVYFQSSSKFFLELSLTNIDGNVLFKSEETFPTGELDNFIDTFVENSIRFMGLTGTPRNLDFSYFDKSVETWLDNKYERIIVNGRIDEYFSKIDWVFDKLYFTDYYLEYISNSLRKIGNEIDDRRRSLSISKLESLLTQLLGNQPNNPDLLEMAADITSAKNPETMERFARKTLKLNPQSSKAHILLIAALGLSSGEGKQIYNNLISLYPVLDVSLYPDSPQYYQNGRFAHIISQNPFAENLKSQEENTDKASRYEYAKALMDRKSYNEALEELVVLNRDYPGDATIVSSISDIYFLTEKTKENMDFLLDSLKQTEPKEYLHFRLADLFYESGRFDLAIKYYLYAAKGGVESQPLLQNLTFSYLYSEQNETALKVATRYGKKYPNDPFHLYLKAYALFKLQRYESAEKEILIAEKLLPGNEAVATLKTDIQNVNQSQEPLSEQ